jgi:hypothetical protein
MYKDRLLSVLAQNDDYALEGILENLFDAFFADENPVTPALKMVALDEAAAILNSKSFAHSNISHFFMMFIGDDIIWQLLDEAQRRRFVLAVIEQFDQFADELACLTASEWIVDNLPDEEALGIFERLSNAENKNLVWVPDGLLRLDRTSESTNIRTRIVALLEMLNRHENDDVKNEVRYALALIKARRAG